MEVAIYVIMWTGHGSYPFLHDFVQRYKKNLRYASTIESIYYLPHFLMISHVIMPNSATQARNTSHTNPMVHSTSNTSQNIAVMNHTAKKSPPIVISI